MRRSAPVLVAFLLCTLVSCAGSPPDEGGTGDVTASPTGSDPPVATTPPVRPSPSTDRSTSSAEELLLAQQLELTLGGDGIQPRCDEEEAPAGAFDEDPSVWVRNLTSSTEYYGLTVLCLRGFAPNQPIEVQVSAGGWQSRTRVEPVSTPPVGNTPLGYEEESTTTLFDDGAVLQVYSRDYGGDPVAGPAGTLVSEMWTFVPPLRAREELATSGRLRIEAVQGPVRADAEQGVAIPTTRDATLLTSEPVPRLVVFGFPEGASVPIGLYSRTGEGSTVTLRSRLGAVTMPSSRVAEYPLDPAALEDVPRGDYCVLPPAADGADCPYLTLWPRYPGPVVEGDRGPRVTAWQAILIQAEVMSDRPANRDGVYGPATVRAVRTYLQDRNLVNPDGDATLGPAFYALLTGS